MAKINLSATQVLDVDPYLVAPTQTRGLQESTSAICDGTRASLGGGLTLTRRPNARTAGTRFLHQIDRRAVWLLMSELQWCDPLTLSGSLFRTQANGFPVSGFDSGSLALQPVRQGALSAN